MTRQGIELTVIGDQTYRHRPGDEYREYHTANCFFGWMEGADGITSDWRYADLSTKTAYTNYGDMPTELRDYLIDNYTDLANDFFEYSKETNTLEDYFVKHKISIRYDSKYPININVNGNNVNIVADCRKSPAFAGLFRVNVVK